MDAWQAELRGLLIGAGTAYSFSGPIGGLGIPTPRTDGDQERGNLDGDVGGADTLPRRILTFPVGIDDTTSAGAMEVLSEIKAAWRPSVADLPLELCLPGFPTVDNVLTFFGRPRGFDVDLTRLKSARADALLTFEALDPYGYGPADTLALGEGTEGFDVEGDGPTDRWELDLTPTGGSVTFANLDDDEPALGLVDVSGGVLVDGRGHDVTGTATLGAGHGWPVLLPGENTLSLTGATGLLTYRPAYH